MSSLESCLIRIKYIIAALGLRNSPESNISELWDNGFQTVSGEAEELGL